MSSGQQLVEIRSRRRELGDDMGSWAPQGRRVGAIRSRKRELEDLRHESLQVTAAHVSIRPRKRGLENREQLATRWQISMEESALECEGLKTCRRGSGLRVPR